MPLKLHIIILRKNIMTEIELYQKHQKLATEDLVEQAIQLATKLNYQAGIESIRMNCEFWGKEAMRDDLCRDF